MFDAMIHDLGKRRNSEAPVHRLPLEILVKIFKLALRGNEGTPQDDLTDIQNGATEFYYQKLIPLSSVCNEWRTVIRDTPAFWSPIQFEDRLRMSKLALERSKSHGVKIIIWNPLELWKDADVFIHAVTKPEVMKRWRSLGLSDYSLWDKFRPMLEIPTPCLETAVINIRDTSARSTIPINLFGGDAPNLVDLVLRVFPITWTSASWPKLRSLEIKFADVPPPSLEQLRHILIISNLLESLVIVDLPEFEPDPIPTHPAETSLLLARLQVFKLLECPSDVLHTLITLVDAPACSTLALTPEDEEEEGWFSNDLIEAITPITERLQAFIATNEKIEISLNEVTLKSRADSGFDLGCKGGETPEAVFCPLTLSWILNTFHAALTTGPVSLSFSHGFDFGLAESMTMVQNLSSRYTFDSLHLSHDALGLDHLLQALSSPAVEGRWLLSSVQHLTLEPDHPLDMLDQVLHQRYTTHPAILPPPEPLKTLRLFYRPPPVIFTWVDENMEGCTVIWHSSNTHAEATNGMGEALA